MAKFDLSNNDMCAEGTKLIAGALKANQVMTELNISSNYAGKVSKCGAADMSGIIVLTEIIKDMGALSLLNLASNGLHAEGTKLLAAALKGNQIMTELNISSNAMTLGSAWGDMSGVIARADVISDMRAMTSLNLADNFLQAEGAKHIAGALQVSKCVLAIILAPLVCQSAQYFNCWCLLLSPGYEGDDELACRDEFHP
jgi:hypothetical protein